MLIAPKVFSFLPNLLPLLDKSNVCVSSQKPFPMAIKQSPPRAHGLLQAEALFPAVVEPEAENLTPPKVDYKVSIFSRI